MTVSEAQANLPRLLKKDTFAISRHGKIVGVYLSRERIEALVETMELMGDKGFNKALRDYEAGKTKFKVVECLDDEN